MRPPFAFIILVACVLLPASGFPQDSPTIYFNGSAQHPAFELRGWEGVRATEASHDSSRERWQPVLAVFVDQPDSSSEIPPLNGSYRVQNGTLVFEPRYPLQPGLQYRAVFRPNGENTAPNDARAETFAIPKPEAGPATFVEQVYPTTGRLPENQLKLYVHFSAPMSRGEAYRRIALLDADGRPISLPFLEIEQELWDPEGKRVTLLFDPGRVKRDLRPNREVGSPLVEGKQYTLVVDPGWPDAAGRPLKEEFRRQFEVGPPDHDPPSEKNWQLSAPRTGARDALTVRFPEPLDQALLVRVIHVTTRAGEKVEGSIEVSEQETRWEFRPSEPWKAGDYFLDAATVLEDLAGNSLERPFEVDVFEKVEERVERVSRTVRFQVAP